LITTLVANRLDRVVIKVAADASGKVELVEFLAPDLTPAAQRELRAAMEGCVFGPGDAQQSTFTLVRAKPGR
jgi:hypothetical protein